MNYYARQDPNPNTVLVVFLVLFVLMSIGLGVWGYQGFADQEELRQKLEKKEPTVKAAIDAKEYFTFVGLELRVAVGDTLTQAENDHWQVLREEFYKDGGAFSKETTRPAVENLLKDIKAQLGGFNDAAKKYEYSYKTRITKLTTDLAEARGGKLKADKDFTDVNQTLQNRNSKINEIIKEWRDAIDKGDKDAFETFKDKFQDNMDKSLKQNEKLQQDLKDAKDAIIDLERKVEEMKTAIPGRMVAKVDPAVQAEEQVAVRKANSSQHALILDMSTGRPYWDESLGNIKSVEGRKVIINLGYEDGIRPGLTFNVFAAGKKDYSRTGKGSHPIGELKGTIEVLRNIQKHSAEALITEQFDPKGNAIKQDDLLFNMFWGTHVVVAGQINWFGLIGTRSEDAANQVRNLDQFLRLLTDQGVIVDAYVDLDNGSIKGTISKRARFLVRGQSLYQPKPDQPKPGEEVEKEAEGVKTKMNKLALKRIGDVNASIKKLHGDCIDHGMFIISAENFAHVAGIQKFRATNGPEAIGFRPIQPFAGE